MNFRETKRVVANRGAPPDSFLAELVEWGRTAPEEIFASNSVKEDIYGWEKKRLATYSEAHGEVEYLWEDSPRHRRAAMLEVMRVHAGFESSWNWSEGVDRTNKTSLNNIFGQETGIFQVSYDSVLIAQNAMLPFAREKGIGSAEGFIRAMKLDHPLALEYYARLVRRNIRWAGPIARREIDPFLSREAMAEFETLLA